MVSNKQANKKIIGEDWCILKLNVFSEMVGQYFSEKERVIVLFFPHQLSAVSREKQEIYFQMRNIKQAQPEKLRLILADL